MSFLFFEIGVTQITRSPRSYLVFEQQVRARGGAVVGGCLGMGGLVPFLHYLLFLCLLFYRLQSMCWCSVARFCHLMQGWSIFWMGGLAFLGVCLVIWLLWCVQNYCCMIAVGCQLFLFGASRLQKVSWGGLHLWILLLCRRRWLFSCWRMIQFLVWCRNSALLICF